MTTDDWYTRAQTAELLCVSENATYRLHAAGYLRGMRVRGKTLFDKDWVDGLVELIAHYTSRAYLDNPVFELYALHRQYREVSAMERGSRERRHAKVRARVRALVDAGRVWDLDRLAVSMQTPLSLLQRCSREGRICALSIGQKQYVTAKYGHNLVSMHTQWLLVEDVCEELNVAENTARVLIRTGEIVGVKGFDGRYRVSPTELARYKASLPAVPTFGDPDTALVALDGVSRRLGFHEATVAKWVRGGAVASVSVGLRCYIPEQEVARLEKWFFSLNAEFEWLQPVVMLRKGVTVPTMTAKNLAKLLGVSIMTVSVWSRLGLLPYFPAWLGSTHMTRLYVQRYAMGLRRYVSGSVTRDDAVAYKQLCQVKGNIV